MNLQSYKWKQLIRKGELDFNFVCVEFNLESLFNKKSLRYLAQKDFTRNQTLCITLTTSSSPALDVFKT